MSAHSNLILSMPRYSIRFFIKPFNPAFAKDRRTKFKKGTFNDFIDFLMNSNQFTMYCYYPSNNEKKGNIFLLKLLNPYFCSDIEVNL